MNAEDAGQEGGREMDSAVAEKVFGYRRVTDTSRDYDGVRHGGEYLVPPDIPDRDLHLYLPPRGAIAFGYFVRERFSTEIAAAWRVVVEATRRGMPATVAVAMGLDGQPDGYKATWAGGFAHAPTAPLAICRAALAALSPTLEERDG